MPDGQGQTSTTAQRLRDQSALTQIRLYSTVTEPGCTDAGAAPQPKRCKPREIVIRCAGPSKPWIIWLEIVFIEWSRRSFSVYARTGEAVPGGAVSLGLLPRTAARLSWREVLAFVQLVWNGWRWELATT